jgi:SAM-dependent methyltransferase
MAKPDHAAGELSPPLAPAAIIRADFDRLAQYDTDAWSHNGHYHGFLLRQLPVPCETALEIGCGAGGLARQLAARAGHVLALDLSPAMIQIAQTRSAGCANIDYRVADALAWDWPPERFDGIVSVATLHHLPLAEIVPRMRDALRPGGVLAVLDLFSSAGPRDWLLDALALPVSAVLSLLKNGRLRESPEARAAWDAHGQHDASLTLADIRQACADILPGAQVRRRLFWRYSLVWRKPAS